MGWGTGKDGSSGGGSGDNDGGQGKHAGDKDFSTAPQNQDHQSRKAGGKHGKGGDENK
ncbi:MULTISPECIES: hypothetical protein [unclassified Kitasatospora]|uniref:hypothetical protein n=1 Tax=unclassified Kitasatospora TaxID=2633591 RepID=UPI00380F3AD5